ncbi:nitronate monooxygenase [Nonomuraea salmonea]|uniref:nitronate monooxygenase n=1 Tax=Nonomuraea salmonea TaxID=46181 RepID=UPI003CD09A53
MGTRFLLTSDSPVPDEVKRVYLAARETVVTRNVDGVPHRVLHTPFVASLERSRLVRAVVNAARFKRLSGLSWGVAAARGAAYAARAGTDVGPGAPGRQHAGAAAGGHGRGAGGPGG